MRELQEIRDEIRDCDEQILQALIRRMACIGEVCDYKKERGLPILQPEQEDRQVAWLRKELQDHPNRDEILDVFSYIRKNSRRIQSRRLFDYNIFLIGFMGAGKTTIAQALQKKLEMDYVELDRMIENKQGMRTAEIFDTYGEDYFRNLESNCLIEIGTRRQTIVSCGGGTVLRKENVDVIRAHGRVVLLEARAETVRERIQDEASRPLFQRLKNVDDVRALMEERRISYEQAADLTIVTDGKRTGEICDELIARLIAFDKGEL